MSDTPHLLIPYAAVQSAGGQQALASLALPHLERLLARLSPLAGDVGDEESPSPPHERALARALGLPGADGHLAWAAWHVRHSDTAATIAPSAPDNAAWAFITPCHWQVSTDHITLHDPLALGLDEASSRALLAVMAPWFEQDGITLLYDQPTRWLAHGEVFADLVSTSLERVLHRDVRAWLQAAEQHPVLRRLHSEMQMLLYTHPWNEAREALRQPTVNAFWVHGAGRLPATATPKSPAPQMPLSLRDAALREDWAAWASAWQQLDAGPVADLAAQVARGSTAQLTLCGECSAFSWHTAPRSLRQRISSLFGLQPFKDVRYKL
ncbi:phosphoglycerate mutase [Simplicispira psychrophila]|uniref:phosphoglycerate mutase n=1 Tax=Simplicispira psychrophila TaxID=80882 RepID=UPI00047F496F|nr:phosphoglycerate mutase [Simplicispira psychrophila]